jgi:DNA-directed RNA polymerase subunit RPC12/RpoP
MTDSIDNNSISTIITEKKDLSQKSTESKEKIYEENTEYENILCPHCEKKIFYNKKYTKRLRGINIKFLSCLNFFL